LSGTLHHNTLGALFGVRPYNSCRGAADESGGVLAKEIMHALRSARRQLGNGPRCIFGVDIELY